MDNNAAINRAEIRFRALFDAQPNMVTHISGEGVFLDINSAGCRLLGYQRQEIIGQPLSLLVPEDSLHDSEGKILTLKRGIAVPVYRKELRAKDGRLIPCELNLTATVDENGEFVIQSIARDLREELETERRLQTSQELFRALVESAVDSIFIKDTESRFTMVNQAFLDLTGRTAESLLGYADDEFLPPDQAEHVMAEDQRVIQEGITIRGESAFLLERKKNVILEYTKAPVRGGQGEIIGLVAIARDVTRERSLANRYLQTQKMEAIGSLAGSIAHDFNNLLTGLIGNLSIAQKELPDNNPAQPFLNAALNAGETASELTRQLLQLSEQQPINITSFSIAEVIEEVAALMSSTIDRRMKITTRIAEGLWPVYADRMQIRQVLVSLCLNARDALQRRFGPDLRGEDIYPWLEIGTENVTVRPGASSTSPRYAQTGDYVKITVSDNGIGMSTDVRERVFEPFYLTNKGETASGLGMAMASAIIANHGGWFTVESEPNMGADFIFYLPKAVAERQTTTVRKNVTERDYNGAQRILAIDDDPTVRQLIYRFLHEEGYQVDVVENGARGWEYLQQHGDTLHLLIVDLIMPEMSGRHFIEMLRKEGYRVPVLICSGYPGDIADEGFRAIGAEDFLAKPFNPQQLIEKVRAVIRRGPTEAEMVGR